MNSHKQETWLKDVERANLNALSDWETILNQLENMLVEPWNRSAASVKESSTHWIAAIQAAGNASRRLTAGLKLTDSRCNDARRAGLPVVSDLQVNNRAKIAGQRTDRISSLLRERMLLLSSEMQDRRCRRPNNRVFAGNTPSLVDMHV